MHRILLGCKWSIPFPITLWELFHGFSCILIFSHRRKSRSAMEKLKSPKFRTFSKCYEFFFLFFPSFEISHLKWVTSIKSWCRMILTTSIHVIYAVLKLNGLLSYPVFSFILSIRNNWKCRKVKMWNRERRSSSSY